MGELTLIVALGVALMTVYLMRSFSVEGISAGHRLVVLIGCLCVGAYFLAGLVDSVQTGEISCRRRSAPNTCYREEGIFSFLLAQAHFLVPAVISISVSAFLLLKRK
jgi:hypothetical protein